MSPLSTIGVAILLSTCTLLPASAEEVEHPIYKSWAKYPIGTTATVRSITEQAGQTVTTQMRYTLLTLDDKKVVVELEVTSDATGKSSKDAKRELTYNRWFPLFPGVKKEDIGKPEGTLKQGRETIKLAGREFDASWFEAKSQTEAGPAVTRIWMSDEAPGKLLKSETRVPKAQKLTTLELIEIKKP